MVKKMYRLPDKNWHWTLHAKKLDSCKVQMDAKPRHGLLHEACLIPAMWNAVHHAVAGAESSSPAPVGDVTHHRLVSRGGAHVQH